MLKGKDRDKAIIRRLEEWGRSNPDWPPSVDTGIRLLRLAIETKERITPPGSRLTRDAISSILMKGKSILSFADLVLDWTLFEETFRSVVPVLTGEPSDGGDTSRRLCQLAANTPLLRQVSRDFFSDTPLSATASEHCIDAAVLEDCIRAALSPFLSVHAESLSDLIAQELWRRKLCPACGALADFAYLEADGGARWLVCSRCGLEWLFQRIQCPYCGTQKHESLSYRTNSQGIYQIYTCEECRRYVKGIDLRRAGPDVLLPLERVLTLDLDRQAREAGYRPGSRMPSWAQPAV